MLPTLLHINFAPQQSSASSSSSLNSIGHLRFPSFTFTDHASAAEGNAGHSVSRQRKKRTREAQVGNGPVELRRSKRQCTANSIARIQACIISDADENESDSEDSIGTERSVSSSSSSGNSAAHSTGTSFSSSSQPSTTRLPPTGFVSPLPSTSTNASSSATRGSISLLSSASSSSSSSRSLTDQVSSFTACLSGLREIQTEDEAIIRDLFEKGVPRELVETASLSSFSVSPYRTQREKIRKINQLMLAAVRNNNKQINDLNERIASQNSSVRSPTLSSTSSSSSSSSLTSAAASSIPSSQRCGSIMERELEDRRQENEGIIHALLQAGYPYQLVFSSSSPFSSAQTYSIARHKEIIRGVTRLMLTVIEMQLGRIQDLKERVNAPARTSP